MRWKLAEEEDASGQASLFAEEEIVDRHVGTGEYRGLEFHHVRARSIINEVPGAQRLPFRWTINPYRGCSHSCVYCLSGETPVLLGDGRHVPLADVEVGADVYGTERTGDHRTLHHTTVLAKWETVKRAYRLTLEDGTTLVTSGDHRFLTDDDWKFVTGAGCGGGERPHLTTTDHLVGTGAFAEQPKRDHDYELGHLTATARGEALTALPDRPSSQWRRGFVAGLFDAEGSSSGGVLRVTHADERFLALYRESLDVFGFGCAVETRAPGAGGPVAAVRLTGDEVERLRFFHTFDPAITWKREMGGDRIENDARLRVVSVDDLGFEIPMYDITTTTGDFIANGVVSHNCFARPTHDYLGFNIGSDFDSKIVVKVNAVEKLRSELAARRWAGEHIAMGTNTDPYQRCEGKYRLTQGIVRTLGEHRNPFSILTKSTLILRDLPLLVDAAKRTDVRINFSIGTLDERTWKETEPGTPHPRRRVEAVRRINDAGIPCGVLVAPVIPGFSDSAEQVEEVVRACLDAGAVSISAMPLHLRKGVKEHWMAWLRDVHPDLVPLYAKSYKSAYLSKSVNESLTAAVRRVTAEVRSHRLEPWLDVRTRSPRGTAAGTAPTPPETAEPPVQQSLL